LSCTIIDPVSEQSNSFVPLVTTSSHFLADEHRLFRASEYFGAFLSRITGELHATGALPPAAVSVIPCDSMKLSKNTGLA